MSDKPDRNFGMDLARVTEAAALAAARWMGRGDKNGCDQAAVDAMRLMLNSLEMDGIVVIGEGEKDEAPMLYNGERLGTGNGPKVDIAVDPIDGTRLLAKGQPNSLAVVALSERGTMFSPGNLVYMNKIAVGPRARGTIDIDAPVIENLTNVARALDKELNDLTVVILDRPRHEKLIAEVRKIGSRIKLIGDGDISGGLMPALEETGIDILMGIGGSPEAVVTACALKCLRGEIQAKLWPRDDEERRTAKKQGMDLDRVYSTDDLVSGDNVFFAATGTTDGELLTGVTYTSKGARTSSIMMRSKSGTVRRIEAQHRRDKLIELDNNSPCLD